MRRWLPAVLLLACPLSAEAHGTSKSFAELILRARTAELRINFAGHDVAAAIEGVDADQDRRLTRDELEASREAVGRHVVEHLLVKVAVEDGAPQVVCQPEVTGVKGIGDPVVSEVQVRAQYGCSERVGFLHLEVDQLPALEPPHITVATVLAGPTAAQHVFSPQTPAFELDVELPSLAEELGRSALAGLRLLVAPASLLFLLGLLLFERPKAGFGLFAVYLGALLAGSWGMPLATTPDWLRLCLAGSVALVGAELVARKTDRMPIYKPIAAAPAAFLHGAAVSVVADPVGRAAASLAQAAIALLLFAGTAVLAVLLGARAGEYRRSVGVAWLAGAGALTALVFL